MRTRSKLLMLSANVIANIVVAYVAIMAQEIFPDRPPTKYQLIRYRDQQYHNNVNDGFGSSDEEFMKGLMPYRVSKEFNDKSLDNLAPRLEGLCMLPLIPDANTYYTVYLGEYELTIGSHTYSVSTGRLYWNYASLRVPIHGAGSAELSVLNWNAGEIGLQTPGTDAITVEWKQVKTTIVGERLSVLVRKSQRNITEFEWIKGSMPPVARPIPLPENEETAAKRGAVRVGDPMDLALKRLADTPQGALAHPPEGSSWSSFWVYGDGLLAIEVDPATNVIRKLAYVLAPASESPVFLPLNRIHLTDGEMFMPIPPPPARNIPGPQDKESVAPSAESQPQKS